jgi:hypothetical protein
MNVKIVVVDRMNMDELVMAWAELEQLRGAYVGLSLQAPSWLTDNQASVRREIELRRKDDLWKALQNAKSRMESLKTPEEKRGDLRAEIDRLQAQLGV